MCMSPGTLKSKEVAIQISIVVEKYSQPITTPHPTLGSTIFNVCHVMSFFSSVTYPLTTLAFLIWYGEHGYIPTIEQIVNVYNLPDKNHSTYKEKLALLL